MRKIILHILIFTCISTSAISNIYLVPNTIKENSQSLVLNQDFVSHINADLVPITPILDSKASLTLPQIGVLTAYATSHSKELSQVGALHSVVNSNYTHVSKTFQIDLLT